MTASTAAEPAPRRAVVSFWCEQGLSSHAAEQLVRRLEESGRRYSLEQLSAKVQRLQRVLPDVDLAAMVDRDTELLEVDPGLAIRNMVVLVSCFPGKDMALLLARQPRLLREPELQARCDRTLAQLTRLHPSRDPRVVAWYIGEYPELLYRMDYYPHVRLLDELPIEIQNMFVVNGQGIGGLHKYYKQRRSTAYTSSTDSDVEAGF
ncbi:hypothetical protein HYH03_008694 [Edaphochlamys debaryana]|uniref:Uncharacterized protein n=1 Tax=Edaphochlamys debaryana TaxID=47281 RepID=A0A836BXR3_9CHLO|nr:hypothetical protein HYH03_008694 [Edaphochlamys debaryana]|eukprot:KAG2493031.1 hypothetical protein HYH03_008694 [Edaphochlamys debaryana]